MRHAASPYMAHGARQVRQRAQCYRRDPSARCRLRLPWAGVGGAGTERVQGRWWGEVCGGTRVVAGRCGAVGNPGRCVS